MLPNRVISALAVIVLVLLVALGPATRPSFSSSSLVPTPTMHVDESDGLSTASEPAPSSNIYHNSANSAALQEATGMPTDRGFSTGSLEDTEVNHWPVTAGSWPYVWSSPTKRLPVETNRHSFTEAHEIKLTPRIVYAQAEDPPLVLEVTTDRDSYHTDEMIYITANITHQNGTVMAPPGWANVSIAVWDITAYYWTVLPNAPMTYNSGTNLWEHNHTVGVTDPSAQFPFHWNITVVAYDGVLDAGVGYTTVNTLVYVGPGVSHAIQDGWFPEFGSIVVDGGILSTRNATVPMVPAWDMACNLTVRNNGTITMEDTAIGSLSGNYWIFWVLDDSEAHLNHAEVYDVPSMLMGPPGLMAAFYSSVFITNSSYIDSAVGAMFSGRISMEDSEAAEGAILMENSEGSFHNVTMPQLMLQSHCKASIENSDISGDAIFVALFSQIDIVNSYIDVVAVMGNSTATIANSTVDEQVAIVYSSSLTADNLTIGDDMVSSVRLDVSGHSECDISDFKMTGDVVNIALSYMAKAAFHLVNWTATHIDLRAEDNVELTFNEAFLDATAAIDSAISLTLADTTIALSKTHIQATSLTQVYISDQATASFNDVDICVTQPAGARAWLYFSVYQSSNVTLDSCNFNATGPFNWNTEVGISFESGVQATITNLTVFSAYHLYNYVGYDTLATISDSTFCGLGDWCYFSAEDSHIVMTSCNVTFGNSGYFGLYDGTHATVTACQITTGFGWGGVSIGSGASVNITSTDLDTPYIQGDYGSHLLLESCSVAGGMYLSNGAQLEIHNATIGDYLELRGGCEATIHTCSIGFGPNVNGYVNIYEGTVATMSNVNINLSSWDFRVDSSCDVTLENVDLISPFGYNFGVYGASTVNISNSSINLDPTQFGEFYMDGGALTIVGAVVEAFSFRLNSAVYSFMSNTELYTPVNIDGGCMVTMESCLLNSTLVSQLSHATLTSCAVNDDVTTAMGGSLALDTTTIAGILYVGVAGTISITDSLVTIEAMAGWPQDVFQSVSWLNTYDSTVTLNGTTNAMWIYNLHNHHNASTIYSIGTIHILRQRWCLEVHAADDYGDPIPSAFVEIRNSTMALVHSGYTDGNGIFRVYPDNGVYHVTVYANGKTDTATVTINDMCAEASCQLDVTDPIIDNVAQDPTTPNYKQSVTVTAEISDPTGIASVVLKYNDGGGWTDVAMSLVSGTQYSSVIPAQSYGAHVLYYIVAIDNSDNIATSTQYSYTVIDNLMPEASGFTLDPLLPVYYQDVTVTVTLTDPNGVVEAWLLFSVNDAEYRSQLTSVEANRYSTVIPKQPFGTDVTYSVWAKDGLDNTGTTAPLTYTVTDDVDPTGEIISPSTDSFHSGTIEITVAGHDTNFDRMELYVNDDLKKTWITSGIQNQALDTAPLADGSYTFKLVVYDKAGNSVETMTIVTMDKTNPTVSITDPEPDSELLGLVSINFDASDTNLDKIYLQIDEATLDITGSSTYNWDTAEIADGSHTIKIIVTDKAGNEGDAQVTVKTTNVAKAVGDNMMIGFAVGSAIFLAIGAAVSYFLVRRKKPTRPANISKPAETSKRAKTAKSVEAEKATEAQKPKKSSKKKSKSKRKPKRKPKT